jgi:hypothetical protein
MSPSWTNWIPKRRHSSTYASLAYLNAPPFSGHFDTTMTPLKMKLAVIPFILYLTGLGVAAAAAAVAALEPQDMCTFAGLPDSTVHSNFFSPYLISSRPATRTARPAARHLE